MVVTTAVPKEAKVMPTKKAKPMMAKDGLTRPSGPSATEPPRAGRGVTTTGTQS